MRAPSHPHTSIIVLTNSGIVTKHRRTTGRLLLCSQSERCKMLRRFCDATKVSFASTGALHATWCFLLFKIFAFVTFYSE